MTQKEILEKLVEIRKEKRISQRKLAERLGISGTYLSVIERGRVVLSLQRFFQMCEGLGVKPHRVLESKNRNPEREEVLMNLTQDLSPGDMELLVGIAQLMRDQRNIR